MDEAVVVAHDIEAPNGSRLANARWIGAAPSCAGRVIDPATTGAA
jgi:hypothetical protein